MRGISTMTEISAVAVDEQRPSIQHRPAFKLAVFVISVAAGALLARALVQTAQGAAVVANQAQEHVPPFLAAVQKVLSHFAH